VTLTDQYRPAGVTASRPLILLADQAWDAAGGGAVILRSLLGNAVGDGIIWVTPSRAERDLGRGHWGLTAGSAGRSVQFSMLADLLRHPAQLAAEVSTLAEELNAAGIWAVLHGATLGIAARLAQSGRHPLHVSVHDDPVYVTALRSRRLALFAPLLARDFRTALTGARSVDVVCQSMGERYRDKFGVDFAILHRGLSDAPRASPPYDLKTSGLSVGILGNTYSYHQLPLLGRAVELAAARLGVRGRIVVCGRGYGERLGQDMQGKVDVEVVGHIPEPEGIERLRHCGVLYLNYPFGVMGKVLRETSFPTKLSTYIYAARPILLHAPGATSVADLQMESGYITAWPTLNADDGAQQLTAMFRDPRFANSHHLAGELVRSRYYDLASHRATLDSILSQLLGAPRSSTQPCIR
jgi:hypothetical protein